MKVLQILPELNSGGVERGTLEVADYLVKKGHKALVVSNGGRMVEALEKSGARHILMPVHKKSPGSLLQVKPFRKLLEKERPDILHIRSRAPGWIAWLAWRGMNPDTRPRLVTTVHGFYSVNRYSAIMTKGERVIAVSNSIREYILKNYPKVTAEKIRVIHRGVSPEQFPKDYRPTEEWLSAWRTSYPKLVGRKILLLPGRITRWKGHEDFIRLISGLRSEGMGVHGLILGDTHSDKKTYEARLKELTEMLDIKSEITFLGYRKDVRDVMSISDLIVSLSKSQEAFGRVVSEAAALGKPILGYDHGGVSEQLEELFPQGRVPVGDVSTAIEVARLILQNQQIPIANNFYTLERMLSATISVYSDLLQEFVSIKNDSQP
ncbi:MAG: glycosyltransferase family 4 protein [Armatimonadetes bacterium]|nr:glycosyltransferase family 4 protein [Akkermansiaceae bacterium]